MTIGNYVYHQTFGFGIISDIINTVPEVTFYAENQPKAIVATFLDVIPDETVSYFINMRFETAFTSAVLKRGENYFSEHKVTEIQYSRGKFEAVVYGSRKYTTSVFCNKHTRQFVCSCPVESECKHAAALCYELSMVFRNLSGQTKQSSETLSLNDPIIQAYDNIRRGIEFSQNSITVSDELCSKDDTYLISFLKYAEKIEAEDDVYRYKRGEHYIYIILSYSNVLRQRILNLTYRGEYLLPASLEGALNKGSRLNENYLKFGAMSSTFIRVKFDYLFFVLNGLYEEYIKYTIYNFDYTPNPEAVSICAKHMQYSEKLYSLLTGGRIYDLNPYRDLVQLFPPEKKLELFQKDISYTFSYQDLKDFSREDRLSLLSRANINPEDIAIIMNNDIDFQHDNYLEIAAIILSLYKDVLDKKTKKSLRDQAVRLPDANCFVEYLENRCTSFSAGEKRYAWYYNANILYGSVDKMPGGIDKESLTKYFRLTFEMERSGSFITTTYYLKDAIGRDVIMIRDNGRLIVEKNFFSEDFDCKYAYYLVWYVRNELKESYDASMTKFTSEILEDLEKERCRSALQDLKTLSDKCIASSMLLSDSKKAKLEYHFTIESEIMLNLKIGIDRFYVVKDVASFLDYFYDGKTVSYGKSLSLYHTLENIDPKDRCIIEYLMSHSPEFSRDKKNIFLDEYMSADIFSLLKGRTVDIDGSDYVISLDDIVPKIKVDSDYKLSCSFDGIDKLVVFSLRQISYIIDRTNKKVDVYRGTPEQIELFAFCSKYNGLRIKRIAEQFKSQLYLHFSDQVEISEELKPQFKLSIVTVKAYFDYENQTITVKKEYYKDDKKVSLSQCNDSDKMKINNFEQYLTTLGFVNDVIADDGMVLSFFYLDFSELKKHCEVYLSESITNKVVNVFSPATIKISYDGVVMKALLDDSQYSDEELEAIIRAIRHKKKFVLLKNSRIVDLSNDESKEFCEAVDDLQLDYKQMHEENRLTLVQSLKALAHENCCSVDGYLTNMMDEIRNFKDYQIELPSINGQLRQYQVEGLKWLSILTKYNVGGILADDMGLGKTIQIISLISNSSQQRPSVIICPKTLVFNWKNEFMRFAPDISVKEIAGTKEQRNEIISSIASDQKTVYITSYDSFRNDDEQYDMSFEFAILDEAQYIKNVKAQKTLSVKKINATHRFALTGTPIENNIIDLWSIFDFVMPGYFDDLSAFRNKYNDDKFIEQVSKRIAPFVLRRIKQDVLTDLPDKYETILSVDMQAEQRKIYDAYKWELLQKLNSGIKAFDILPYLTRLRQICVDPKMFVEDYHGDVAKMTLLESLIDDYLQNGHKLLIFSQFVKALNELENLLKKKDLPYFIITGSTDGKDRIDIANRFNNDSEEKILLISLKAGGTGLNLIGADTVIHLDPWWNVAAENQASDRAHRIGQTSNVEIIKIICSHSIEQRVIELQNVKKDLIDKVISNNDESVLTSSLENIKYLLET